MTERQQLQQVIEHLESQRLVLGDDAVNAAILPLREKLASLPESDSSLPPVREPIPVEDPGTVTFTGERRLVTILFCDVKGSTAMASMLDPEEWARTIQRAMEYMIEPVRRHGGKVSGIRGDGMLAFFGAPVTHEDDPQRAVLAGLEIVEAVRGFGGRLRRDRGIDFSVRVGIHTGLVVVGELARYEQGEYTAFGDAVNMAARMEQTARPGTVQISKHTYRLIEHAFDCESLGEIQVKGKSRPVPVYTVIGARSTPAPSRGLERRGLSSPLVGRDNEIRCARELLKLVRRGQGGVLGVFGGAGLGKSRLKREVQAEARELKWLEGRTLWYGQAISYWPFREILFMAAGITDQDPGPVVSRKLEAHITGLLGEKAPEVLPYLATLLAAEVQEDYAAQLKYLDADALGKRLFRAMRLLIEASARAEPLVLVFEDLHWMDDSSLQLLEHIVPLVREVPLLLVVVSRPDPDAPCGHLRSLLSASYSDLYTELQLAPLSSNDSRKLVDNLLSAEAMPLRIRRTITRKAEGNPFFIEEILRSLIDMGAIRHDPVGGGWIVIQEIDELEIPDTIQGVIMARLDLLDEGSRSTLRRAAVIGRSFLHRLLSEISPPDEDLDDQLAQLQELELIRVKQVAPELEYMFMHALIHEAAYESILLKKRRELHEQLGRAVEANLRDRLDEFSSLLAHHYALAENWEKALQYLLRAGDHAGKMAADSEALTHYQAALSNYARAFGGEWDPVQRAMLERKIGNALFRRGRTVEAAEHLQDALVVLDQPLSLEPRQLRLSLVRAGLTQLTHLLLPRLFVAPLKNEAPGVVMETAAALEGLSWLSVYLKVEHAIIASLRMLNLSERHGYARGMSFGLMAVGVALTLVGQFRLSRRYLERSYQAAQVSEDPASLAHALLGLRLPYGCLADFEKSLEYSRPAVELCAQIGDLGGWATLMSHIAVMYNYQGRFQEAEKTIDELVSHGRELGDPVMVSYGLSTLGFLLSRTGRLAEAEKCLLEAVEISRSIKNHYSVVSAGGELGRAYLRMGDVERAQETLRQAEDLNRRYRAGWGGQMPLALGLVELHLAKGELEKAALASRQALRQAGLFRPALPDALRLQGTYQWLRGSRTRARQTWRRAITLAEKQGQPYEQALAHLEKGRHTRDRTHLEQALKLLEPLGAAQDIEKARTLLSELAALSVAVAARASH